MLAHVPGARLSIVITLALIALAPQAGAAGWTMEHSVRFGPTDFTLERSVAGWTVASPSGAELGLPGAPRLPVEALTFVLPRGMRIASVEILDPEWAALGGARLAVQGPLFASDGSASAEVADRFGFSGGRDPGRIALPGASGSLEGFSVGSVELLPVRESPDGRLEYLRSGRLALDLEVDPAGMPLSRAVEWPGVGAAAQDRMRALVANSADVARYAPPAGNDPSEFAVERPGGELARSVRPEARRIDFMILTSAELAAEYQPLADRRNAEGLNTVIVTLEELFASATPGADQQETIRNYIRDGWSYWGLQYLMLAGDAELIPPRYARSTYYPNKPPYYTDVPSDLYYAALDGTWNDDGNSIAGEPTVDGVDLYAELSIGRVPLDTAFEVAGWIGKLLAYEEPLDTSFLGRALFLSEVLFPDDWDPLAPEPIALDGAIYSEDLIFDQIIGGGNLMQSWRLYQNHTAYAGAVPETKQASLDSMQTGRFALVNHIGHGFYYNMSVGDDNIFADDAYALTNPNPFFIHALNCSSGAFDVDSLLERYLQNTVGGAVGSAGSSRAAFPFWAGYYQEGFFAEVFVNKNTRLGDAQRAAREVYTPFAATDGGHRWTHFSYHLFCDPTLRMWVSEPAAPVVGHAASIPLGASSLSVTVSAATNTTGAIVAVADASGRSATATVQPGGTALVDLAGLNGEAGSLSVVVTGANLQRHAGTVDVVAGGVGHLRAASLSTDDSDSAPSVGDGDGVVDSGETIEWSFRFSNAGAGGTVSGASATLLPVDAPGATILVDAAVLGDVADGGFVDGSAFVVQLDPTIPDGALLEFAVESTDGVTTWTDPVELVVRSPILVVTRLTVDDTGGGNGDGIVDAGEPVDLVVEVMNRGEADLLGLTATLVSADPAVTINDPVAAWPDLAPDAGAANADPLSMVEADVAVEHYSELQFADAQGHTWTHPFELRAPAVPADPVPDTTLGPDRIALRMSAPAEPHFAGYRAYRRPVGEIDFVEIGDEPSILTGLIVDAGLPALTRFEYQVSLVDSSAVESPRSAIVSASTAPAELSPGFPVRIGRELGGPLAVGDMRGDNTNIVTFGADWIYALDADGHELVDGDSDAQTLGPLGGDPNNLRFSPSGVTMADLDGDGEDEVIGSNWDSREVWVLRADGSNFPGWPQPMNAKSWATPAVGDLDDDGDLEIVVNNTVSCTYVWHHNGTEFLDGDANPGTHGIFQIRSGENFNRSTPALYDLTGDGKLEIIFGSHYRDGITDNLVQALRNDGTNAPGWPQNMGPLGYTVGHVTIGDLNQDGIQEIILQTENNLLNVWEEDGSPFGSAPFPVASYAATKDSRVPAAALADFDYDGQLEMVVVSILGNFECEIMLMEQDGSLMPGWPKTLPGLSESSPVIGDIDGDQLMDVVFGIGGGGDSAPAILYAFSPDGADVAGFPITLPGAVKPVPVICDFDLDGDVDVVYAGYDRFVHVWDMPFPYRAHLAPWPTFQADQHRTGVFRAAVATSVLTGHIELSAAPQGVRVFAAFDGAVPTKLRFAVERTEAGTSDWREIASGLAADAGAVLFVDTAARAGARYEYRVVGGEGAVELRSGIFEVPALRAALHAAVPNPFNPTTTIHFEIPGTAGSLVPARLEVFDLKGRRVRLVHVGPLAPGGHALEWDGKDDRGRGVASGVYLAVLRCAGEQLGIKMSLVK